MSKKRKAPGVSLPETKKLAVKDSTFLKKELGVIAKQDFKKGEVLFTVDGPIRSKPTKYSFSVDLDKHIEPQKSNGAFNFGRYLNHSCNPNTIIRVVRNNGRTPYIKVIARKNIKTGEELAFDYASLEYETAVVNHICKCGTVRCRGKIHGFKDLPTHIVKKYRREKIIPDHLLRFNKSRTGEQT